MCTFIPRLYLDSLDYANSRQLTSICRAVMKYLNSRLVISNHRIYSSLKENSAYHTVLTSFSQETFISLLLQKVRKIFHVSFGQPLAFYVLL